MIITKLNNESVSKLNKQDSIANKVGININKRSQVTIFVVIAILIVGVLLFIFLHNGGGPTSGININPQEDPRGYIVRCAEDSTKKAIEEIIPSGGFVNPALYSTFNGTKVTMMCHTPFNNQLCTNKHPMLNLEVEREITALIKPDIESCFDYLSNQLGNYNGGNLNINVSIVKNKIEVNISKTISFSRNDYEQILSSYPTIINNALYDFLRIENEIINQEVSCNCGIESCNADILQLNRDNRDFEITKPVYSGTGEEVYRVEEVLTGDKFNFAIRNCARMP